MKPPQWIGSALIFTGLLGLASLWSAWAALVVALVWVMFLLPGNDYVDRFEARRDNEKEAEIAASAVIGDTAQNLPSRHLTRTPSEVARAAAHKGCDVVTTGTGAPEGRSEKHGRPSFSNMSDDSLAKELRLIAWALKVNFPNQSTLVDEASKRLGGAGMLPAEKLQP